MSKRGHIWDWTRVGVMWGVLIGSLWLDTLPRVILAFCVLFYGWHLITVALAQVIANRYGDAIKPYVRGLRRFWPLQYLLHEPGKLSEQEDQNDYESDKDDPTRNRFNDNG